MGLFQSKPDTSLGYYPVTPSPVRTNTGSGVMSTVLVVIGCIFILMLGVAFYNFIRRRQGMDTINLFPSSSTDKAPTPIDGKTKTVIPAGEVPLGAGSDYGMQFWMFISDWDYRFGQEKHIIERVSSANTNIKNPSVTLAATDNTLNVRISLYPNDSSAGAASPGAATSGDSFTCSVENVPLQSWFAVSVTVFQRNLDIYINGRLVKSCVLPGVPKPAVGDIILNNDGGFSGSICNVHSYANMLNPDDAKAFFMSGTNCAAPTPSKQAVDPDSAFITLFGYTFRFSTVNKSGKEVSSYTF